MSTNLELARMCVAEAGFNPADVLPPKTPDQAFRIAKGSKIPLEVAWRARELAQVGTPWCCECTLHAARTGDMEKRCRADVRFVQDCGVPRG